MLSDLTATLVGRTLGLVLEGLAVSGSTITVENPFLAFSVDVGCLGGILLWSYIALVFAESKASSRQRFVGILVGLAILVGFNFFRITFSIYMEAQTGVHVHDYFYIFNLVFVLLVWAGWLRTLRLSDRGGYSPGKTPVAA